MTAQHAAARRPWHEAVRDGLRSLRARAAMLARRPSWFRVPVIPGCLPLFPATPAPGAAPGQAPAPWDEEAALRRALHSALFWADPQDAAPDVPASGTAQPAPDAPSGPELDTLPLRATPPSSAQGQPTYAVRPDGLVIVGEDGHLTIATPARQAAARRCAETIAMPLDDGPVVPYWYRVWLAAHPEAEVRAA